MPAKIASLEDRVDLIHRMKKHGFAPSDADKDLLRRHKRTVELKQLREGALQRAEAAVRALKVAAARVQLKTTAAQRLEKVRQQARVAVPRSRSGLPRPSSGAARASPAGVGEAVFDGRSASDPDFMARLQQLGLSHDFHESRIQPPRPRVGAVVAASQLRLEVEQDAARAAAAKRLAAGAVDGRAATAVQVAARLRSLGIEVPGGAVLRDPGKPLTPPQFPSGSRFR